MRVRWWVGPHRVTARRFGLELAWVAYDVALNVLVVYWLGQLAFPSLGLVPPTLVGAAGITGLALVLRRPVRFSAWIRR